MKFSEKWLREWVNPALTTQQLTDTLTMAGLEIESVQPAAAAFTGVIVGKIISVKPHPNAEKLSLCEIDVGQSSSVSVVTGAKNIQPEIKIALAKVGAHLPGIHQSGESLASAEIRGVASSGMLCSKEELAIGTANSDEIWILPPDAPIGEECWKYLQLDDNVIEMDLTPNRGDCLSVLGVAREIATLTGCDLFFPEMGPVSASADTKLSINIQAKAHCPRYVGRSIQNLQPNVTTPLWIQEKLRRSDIRCIHPVVDILNYVMLELGQPMHAFDAKKINTIIVRLSKQGEKISLLDGQELTLQADTLVIADSQQPIAIAGIMGGSESAVSNDTTDVFLESALFTSSLIAGKARQYGLHTDSSFRFERGVDPQLQITAIDRATALICEVCGGNPGPCVEVANEETLPQQAPILLRFSRLVQILGDSISEQTVAEILHRVSCEMLAESQGSEWWVIPPSYRYDITSEIDLIEEVARIVGYNQIPSGMPQLKTQFIARSQNEISVARIKRALVDKGFQEVITYSFVDDSLQKLLFPEEEAHSLINPISQDMGVMRVSLWPGLLNTCKFNQNRQLDRMKIFEVGCRFRKTSNQLIQENVISGLLCGNVADEQWDLKSRTTDFFDVKQVIESIWQLLGYRESLTFAPTEVHACHPGQTAEIFWQGKSAGVLGKLHPKLQSELSVEGAIYVFELKLDTFKQVPMVTFQRPSRFPEIRRDIAMIVDEKLASDSLINYVRKSAGTILRDVKIFDVYAGKGIDSGRKSIAMGLILQHPSRTLVDKEVEAVIQTVVTGLEKEFSAKLRE